MGNFMNDEFVKWIGVIGSVASLIGLPVAIWQIYKTRHAAEAAKDASNKTQKIISQNLLLTDISTCAKLIDDVKSYVRSERYETALIRVTDLITQLNQSQRVFSKTTTIEELDFEVFLGQLVIIRDLFERKVNSSSVKINQARINGQLSEILDELNKWIGGAKVAVREGEQL